MTQTLGKGSGPGDPSASHATLSAEGKYNAAAVVKKDKLEVLKLAGKCVLVTEVQRRFSGSKDISKACSA
jgi:hypothetical protein